MMNNFYILVDTKLKITLEYITELPQNWRNICGLPGLSDEEISDLTWAGWDNLGWINIKSGTIEEYTSPPENLELNKNTLKRLISDIFEKKLEEYIEYDGKKITPDFKTHYLLNLGKFKDYINLKCTYTYYTLSSFECEKICNLIETRIFDYSEKEMKLFSEIENAKTLSDLSRINWNI